MMNKPKKYLKTIINELASINHLVDRESCVEIASLRNNIHNVKVRVQIYFLTDYLYSGLGDNYALLFDYIKKEKPSSIIASNFSNVDELKNAIVLLAEKAYVEGKEVPIKKKRIRPVVSYSKLNIFTMFRKENRNKETFKTVLLGNQERKGFLPALAIYILLILFGFVFIYPIIYMVSYSFMTTADLVDPNVTYVPTSFDWENYFEAWRVLDFPKALAQTALVSVVPSICQTVVCALTAWGLARFQFKGSKILFGIIIFTFLVPSCLVMLPTVALYAKLGITGTAFSYILPALFGQGFKSAVFILIFHQTFKSIPKVIIEAAEIDGASTMKIFFKVGIPSARSAILLTVLLSIVWYYNETVLASLYFGSAITTLPLALESFKASFDAMYSGGGGEGKTANEAVYMAGTVLNILPLVVLYIFTQKFFIQGMDKAGITGE